ncbi:MAG: WYL domain-containing protein [Myxococcaceae bacterium]
MERTERLLDLVALLLDAQEPMPWAELRDAFPEDYGAGTADSAERKFERDKAELLELGIPISFVPADDERAAGYVIDKSAYYLPEVGLTPDELAVLYAAGSAALASGAFPGRQDLAHALRKVGFFSDEPLPAPKVRLELGGVADARELPARLEALWSAINAHKSVDLEYYSPHSKALTSRRVDPWGLALRRGLWTLVGFCHLRAAPRTFHVHRIRALTVNAQKPRSADFEVPKDFRLDDYVATWPWEFRFHPPVDVVVELSGDLAPLVSRLFPGQASQGERARVTVRATDLDGLLKYVLSLGAEARVLSPPEAVDRLRAMARRVLEAHGGGAR